LMRRKDRETTRSVPTKSSYSSRHQRSESHKIQRRNIISHNKTMTFLRFCSLALWLTAVAATPIRDLSLDPINESHCDWPGFEQDDDLDGVMVLYRGHKLAEWRNPTGQQTDWFGLNYQKGTTQHNQYSVTKTWISVLVGMLYRDGFLDWETEHPDKITLGDIFSDEEVWDEMWDIPYPFHGTYPTVPVLFFEYLSISL
jgi:hypothetical protein